MEVPRRRRYGQSLAPNLCLLISQNQPQVHVDNLTLQQAKLDTIFSNTHEVTVLDLAQIYQGNIMHTVAENSGTAGEEMDRSDTGNVGSMSSVLSHSQPNIYTRRKSKLQDLGSGIRGGRSKSADETPVSLKRPYDRYGPSRDLDNSSIYGRCEYSTAGMMKRLGCASQRERRLSCKEQIKSSSRRGANVIMEEEDLESEEDKFDIDSRLQFIQAEAEISKM